MGGVFSSSADECCADLTQNSRALEQCKEELDLRQVFAGGSLDCLRRLIAYLELSRVAIKGLSKTGSNAYSVISTLDNLQGEFLAVPFDLEKYCIFYKENKERFQDTLNNAADLLTTEQEALAQEIQETLALIPAKYESAA